LACRPSGISPISSSSRVPPSAISKWAFNKHGAVSEEDFNQTRKVKQTADLNIIATVKLNSEMEITPDPKEEEKNEAEKKTPVTGWIYFIITSYPLVKEFMVCARNNRINSQRVSCSCFHDLTFFSLSAIFFRFVLGCCLPGRNEGQPFLL
jgi:hypothetical protein